MISDAFACCLQQYSAENGHHGETQGMKGHTQRRSPLRPLLAPLVPLLQILLQILAECGGKYESLHVFPGYRLGEDGGRLGEDGVIVVWSCCLSYLVST